MSKMSGNKNSKSNHYSPIPTKIVKEALNLGKRIGISVTGDETLAFRRITRSLRKEFENKRHNKDLCS